MAEKTLQAVLNRLYEANVPDKADAEYALSLQDPAQMAELFAFADEIRRRHVGNGILLRGIVEFSNHCSNTCEYCGLNKTNTNLARYKLTDRQILNCVEQVADAGIGTVVLQSGEQADLDAYWLAGIIREIKTRFDIAITLSVGERPFDDYALWKEAGADRYLLKIETTNRQLYQKLHPQMSLDNRLKCSKDLGMLGYQNGSGNIIGLPGQTISHIADDVLFFAGERFDMIGIGPFIPHPATALSDCPPGNVEMVLKTVAVTRIVTKDTHLPATTAIGSLNGNDHRPAALTAGANVLMPNFTPQPWRQLYEIYPGKRCSTEAPGTCGQCIDMMATAIGRTIDLSRGDSLRKKKKECA
ncbi:MAG: [FeFe] hydrogenase H-cluster radical SAM maturase HydE [Sedimentisphaerales bacterium]|jgi:biotin synthase